MSETSREAISLLQAVQTEQVGKASALSRSALSHSGIWQAIDTLAEKHKLSASGLARRAGLDPTSFNKSKRLGPDGRERWPSTESISKVLEATGASLDEFLGYLAPTGTPRMPDGVFLPQMSSIPCSALPRLEPEVSLTMGAFLPVKGGMWWSFPPPFRSTTMSMLSKFRAIPCCHSIETVID